LISGKVLHYRVSLYNYFARRFREEGWELKVLGNSLQARNQRPIEFSFTEDKFSYRRYIHYIRETKPEAVILFIHLKEKILWPLIHWLKWQRIPVIYWSKGVNLDEPQSKLRKVLANYIHELSDGILLYSSGQMAFLKEAHRAKAIAANNTMNFADIPVISQSKEEIKREFGIPFKRFALFAGTMGLNGERKKVEHLIEAFSSLGRDDIGAVIVGAGMPESLKSKLDARSTRYLGEIYDPQDSQMSKLFKAADIFVVPGHIGLGLNQAFYWGLPVVTEEGNQPPEIHALKSGRNGFMVPIDDIAQLKEKILYLLENEEIRSEFATHARHDIMATASTEGMFESFLKAVQRVTSPSRNPSR
jgi:glycosyltransferase involved in cell wall biosynthesis